MEILLIFGYNYLVILQIFLHFKEIWGDEKMDKKAKECVERLRDLVSSIQGAPFPSDDIKLELYSIWYDHAQRSATECFEFLNDNFPESQKDMNKMFDKLLKK